MKKKKIMYVSGPGGHFTEIERLFEIFPEHEKFIVTCKRQDTEAYETNLRKYFITAPYRNILRLIINFFQSMLIIIRERPQFVITTGAGIGLFCCYLAKLFGAKITHIECSAQVSSPSMFGRLISPIVSKRFVQWESMLQFYPNAKLIRLLFSVDASVHSQMASSEKRSPNVAKVFVTVGTTKENFDRLINAIAGVAHEHSDTDFFVQYGSSSRPNIPNATNFLTMQEFGSYIDASDVIITHAGVGCIASSIRRGKRVIIVPRLAKYAEHKNDHQLQIAARIGELMDDDIYLEDGTEQDLSEWISIRLKSIVTNNNGINWMPEQQQELKRFRNEITEYLE